MQVDFENGPPQHYVSAVSLKPDAASFSAAAPSRTLHQKKSSLDIEIEQAAGSTCPVDGFGGARVRAPFHNVPNLRIRLNQTAREPTAADREKTNIVFSKLLDHRPGKAFRAGRK